MSTISKTCKINIKDLLERHHNCFVIAEIGQNHQGDFDIAKKMIIEAKKSGANCVKFQKTSIPEKFNKAFLAQTYNSSNAWGSTYGEHKQHLEFSLNQFYELKKIADQNNIYFSASAMDLESVDFLANMDLPFIKIGSGDSNNIPLIEHAASKYIPLIISTGMVDKKQVEKIYQTVTKYHKEFCLLHCVSSYPTPNEDLNLNVIKDFQKSFPDIQIGYSGHELGTIPTLVSVALGAKVVERHFTLDKNQKGTDHKCSLTPNELTEMIQQIKVVKMSLGKPLKTTYPSEKHCIDKLQKSLTASHKLGVGHAVVKNDVKIKVTHPKGINGLFYDDILGRILQVKKEKDEPFFETDFI